MRTFLLLLTLFFPCAIYSDPLIQKISERVIETIHNTNPIPGLQEEEFQSLKEGALAYWSELVEKGELKVFATDQEVRPLFGYLQTVVEAVLAREIGHSIKTAFGMIHTPMPATPLCSEGEISPELVDPAVLSDPARLFSVKARTTVLRFFLLRGGILIIAYPKGGLQKRTNLQQEIYLNEVRRYPARLIDSPLVCDAIPEELIGASYSFQSEGGKECVFAIQMTQAKEPRESAHFALWFGEMDHPAVNERFSKVVDFVLQFTRRGMYPGD